MTEQRDEPSERADAVFDPDDVERELRQLQLMSKTLDDFRSGRISIQRTIIDMEALAQELKLASSDWHNCFVDAWADLEIAYAVALDQLTPIPDATDWTVRDGLFELSRLIDLHRVGCQSLADPRYPCPCCGYLVFVEPPGSYDICPICFWEDDIVQLRWPDLAGGANRPSLIDSQINYQDFGAVERRILEHVRAPDSVDNRETDWRPLDPGRDRFKPRGEKTADWPDNPTVLYWWRPTYWR